MKNVLTVIALLFSILTPTAHAATPVDLPYKVDIIGVRAYHGGSGYFVRIPDVGYWEGCAATQNTGIYYLAAGSEDVYRLLMLAKSEGQQVLLTVVGYDQCHGGATGFAKIFQAQYGDW